MLSAESHETRVSSGVIQCEVSLSSGDLHVRSRGQANNGSHMSCGARNISTDTQASEPLFGSEGLSSLQGAGDLFSEKDAVGGQGVLLPYPFHFQDEESLEAVGVLESSLHLVDWLEARVPVSLAACFVQESSLGARLQAVGNGSQVESVTQTSAAEACTCAAQEMTSRTISNKNDILLPMMAGQMSSDHEALDACKLYEMCWYAQNPVVSMDTMLSSDSCV